jgi:hypothetical protein
VAQNRPPMDLLGLGLLLWDFCNVASDGRKRRYVPLACDQLSTSGVSETYQQTDTKRAAAGQGLAAQRPARRHSGTDPYLIEVSRHTGLDSGHIDALARITDRQLVIRDKKSKRSLQSNLDGAHVLVPHGSIAAVESVILGCPVFVHPDSAAALVGRTDLSLVEKPAYPALDKWLWSLAHSQFDEKELVDGTLWKLIV